MIRNGGARFRGRGARARRGSGRRSARARVDLEGPHGLDAELAAAQAHFEASREER